MFISAFRPDSIVGWLNLVNGLLLTVAAIGLVELAMAVWYRHRRRRLARNRSPDQAARAEVTIDV